MKTTLLLLAICSLAWAGETAGLAPIPDADWTLDHAAHLLRRAGFGGTPAEVRALHALGPAGAVDRLLDWEGRPDPELPTIQLALTSRPDRDELRGLSREQRQAKAREYRRRDYQQLALVREWWMQCMIRTAHPLRERLVLFWHGHFTSGYRDVRNSYHMYVQNTLFRRYAAGHFGELLHAISKDPAMLEYLDNNRNRKGRPNENYAREVMELFTLGEGHYTEKDIREAARALTGWTFAGNRFRFEKRQHDDGEKTILGRTGNFDGDGFLDILLDQPQARRHVASRLFAHFAHDHPDESDIDGLAYTLERNDWQLRPMLRELFLSREFYSPRSLRTRIKGPVELIVQLHRSLGMDSRGALGLSYMAEGLGQALLDPPNVKGWPGGRAWITTSTLLNRYNLCGALVGLPEDKARTMRNQRMRGMGVLMQAMRGMDQTDDDEGSMMAEMRALAGGGRNAYRRGRTYDVLATIREANAVNPEEIVDFFCRSLLAAPPPPAMRKTLLEHLARGGDFSLGARDARERLHGLLRLIVSTPEYQLT